MKISLPKASIGNPDFFLRRAGYGLHTNHQGHQSFVRRLDAGNFPRLHLYYDVEGETIVFNIHLDQRAPLYPGQTAHSGEYDGPVVEREAERLQKLVRR